MTSRLDMEKRAEWKTALLNVQRDICPYCGRWIVHADDFDEAGKQLPRGSIDHVWPRGSGGPDVLGNVLCGHSECNNRKGGRLPYPCELLWLLTVNTQLGIEPQELPT